VASRELSSRTFFISKDEIRKRKGYISFLRYHVPPKLTLFMRLRSCIIPLRVGMYGWYYCCLLVICVLRSVPVLFLIIILYHELLINFGCFFPFSAWFCACVCVMKVMGTP